MTTWRDRTRKHWCFGFKYQGKRYTGRGYNTRREANTACEQKRMEVKEIGKQILPGMDFKYVSSLYLDYAERKFAKKTYKYKVYVYKKFIKKNGNLDIMTITPQHIHDYLNKLPTNNQYNVHRKELSSLFTYARRRLKIDIHNPCVELDKMPHSPQDKLIPTEEEIIKLILAANPKTDEQDLVLCVLHTMGRIDEILRLKWPDVNLENKTITLWTRKRKSGAYESDTLPMNQDLYDVLSKRWKERDQDQWVFWNKRYKERYMHRPKLMRALCKRAKIPYYGFHCLRHFMSSYLADKEKVSLKSISGLLRHQNLKTTEIYLHSVDESQRSAMKGIEGKFTSKNEKVQPEGTASESAK